MPALRGRARIGSLSVRLLVPLLATIVAVLAVAAWFNVRSVEQQFTSLVEASARRSAGLIERAAHDGMLLNRKDRVQKAIHGLAQDPGVAAIRIYDMGGTVAMSSRPGEIGRTVPLEVTPCVACHVPGRAGALPETAIEQEHPRAPDEGPPLVRHVSVIANEPDCSRAGCHASPQVETKLGVLEVELSMQALQDTLARSKTRTLWTIGALMLITTLLSAGVLARVVLRPVERLYEGTRCIARGELDTRIAVRGDHELARLAEAFNGMAHDLAAARDELAGWSHELERKVLRKSEELQRTQRQVMQMDRMASLGKLSATVAHELNNPISSMLTYARLVERQLADAERLTPELKHELGEYLHFLQQECARCGAIAQNLLLFARDSAGAEMAPIDVNEAVRRALMLIRHHLEVSDVRLASELLACDPTIVADVGEIEQALVALMVNAVEAMTADGGRGGELTVALRAAGDDVEIAIGDTGVGIPEEERGRIFEPFYSTKSQQSGVGLGLSVAYGIVQRHGGGIEVDSEPGRGTTFRIRLPRRGPSAAGGSRRSAGDEARPAEATPT